MSIPNDPLFISQWHLRNSNPSIFDLNIFDPNGVDSLWDNYTGAGVNVFVIDDAFDYLHKDLAGNYDTILDYDWESNDSDPFGGPALSHGTAVMGLIGAVGNNGIGVTGVAYESKLVGYQTADTITNAWLLDVRVAINSAQLNAADVVNISQALSDDVNSEFGAGYVAARFTEIDNSINLAVVNGRGGLGATLVKSSGDGRGAFYDVNSDPWANNTQQVIVAAVNQDGFISSTSSDGAPNLVSGFGTSGEILTTDRTGGAGYNAIDYSSMFSGTSAAAPMVAGVVALMYEAEAGLGWRDVQDILAYSARHVDSVVDGSTTGGSERTPWDWNGASNWNSGGLHYSNDYGYGLVDAHAAVRLAESWLAMDSAHTSANEVSTSEDAGIGAPVVIPGGNLTGTSFGITESDSILIDRVTLELDFSTTFLADLEIYLTSPDGDEHLLIRDQAGSADYDGIYTFESQAFRGEHSNGDWTVRIVDDAFSDPLTIRDIDLHTFGTTASTDDRYIFTNEFSDYAGGMGGHSAAITDSNGGSDWINAAALRSGTMIDLLGSSGNIDGVAVTISGIENAITGDGDDEVKGNNAANHLYGMRGNDMLEGLAGNDELFGGRGNDMLSGGLGNDVLDGGAGSDTADFSGVNTSITVDLGVAGAQNTGQGMDTFIDVENVTGGNRADTLSGDGNANTLFGNAGNDILSGLSGNDVLGGGAGNDAIDGGGGIDIVDFSDATGALNFTIGTASYSAPGLGTDTLSSIEGVFGSAFNDTLTGNAGNNWFRGGNGGDVMDGMTGTDTADYSTALADVSIDLRKSTPQNTFQGTDTLISIENLVGSDFGDRLQGNNRVNQIDGGDGNDRIYGNSSGDTLNGNGGADLIIGDSGEDIINGNDGIDRLYGGSGDDELFGGPGADSLAGGPGVDRVNGGDGADRLFADSTADTFVFENWVGYADRIFNFQSGVHTLEVDAVGFGGTAGAFGLVSGANPVPGAAIQTFLYDTDDGRLYFDHDGFGGHPAAHVLSLWLAPGLAATDIDLV